MTAILPGYCRESAGLTYYEFLGTEFESTDYTRMIEAGTEAGSLLSQLIDALLTFEPGLDVLHLSNMLESDLESMGLERHAVRLGHPATPRFSASARLLLSRETGTPSSRD